MTDAPEEKPAARLSLLLAASAIVGLALAGHAAWVSSATYDEVTYLRVAARWWRTGVQDEITRMGSPITFWKLQQVPVMASLDAFGYGDWVDHAVEHQSQFLRAARLGSLWVWLAAWAGTVVWARWRFGGEGALFAGWLFALSPNLLAHGGLVTMEMPLIAASAWLFACFDRFLLTKEKRWFWASAAAAGLAFSCKFTAFVYPPILGLAWIVCEPIESGRYRVARCLRISAAMVGFVGLMILTNLLLTGFARLPISEGVGEHPFLAAKFGAWATRWAEIPWPQDWVGFLTQLKHQRSGGPSFLLGEVRSSGWWYYYPVALAVKTPLALSLLIVARLLMRERDRFPVVVVSAFLLIAMVFSKRNYGVRYLLPMSPLAIVWLSALATRGRWRAFVAWPGVAGFALAVALVHPHELSFFNQAAGGTEGGRRILADSNLDWGQGLRSLARMQSHNARLRDLTLYYFGDTVPYHYQVAGICHLVTANDHRNQLPERLSSSTRYLAVSSSLIWGPWGPPGYFDELRNRKPIAQTDDGTILIFE